MARRANKAKLRFIIVLLYIGVIPPLPLSLTRATATRNGGRRAVAFGYPLNDKMVCMYHPDNHAERVRKKGVTRFSWLIILVIAAYVVVRANWAQTAQQAEHQ